MTFAWEQADLRDIEAALDELEWLHDMQSVGDEDVRHCLCKAAASWTRAIKVTAALRERLGMRKRLLDQPVPLDRARSAP